MTLRFLNFDNSRRQSERVVAGGISLAISVYQSTNPMWYALAYDDQGGPGVGTVLAFGEWTSTRNGREYVEWVARHKDLYPVVLEDYLRGLTLQGSFLYYDPIDTGKSHRDFSWIAVQGNAMQMASCIWRSAAGYQLSYGTYSGTPKVNDIVVVGDGPFAYLKNEALAGILNHPEFLALNPQVTNLADGIQEIGYQYYSLQPSTVAVLHKHG